jgi:hypothetical protein
VPSVTYIQGRQAFLHRARVAREQEDVESFRHLRNELIQYWYNYLEREERKKNDMNKKMSRMLDSDIYPSHEWEQHSSNTTRRDSNITEASSSKSPVALDATAMAKEGIPMTANPRQLDYQFTGCTMMVIPRTPATLQQHNLQLQMMMRRQQQQQQMIMMQSGPGGMTTTHQFQHAQPHIPGQPLTAQQQAQLQAQQQAQQVAFAQQRQAQQQAFLQHQVQQQRQQQEQQVQTCVTNNDLAFMSDIHPCWQQSMTRQSSTFLAPAQGFSSNPIPPAIKSEYTSHDELYDSPSPAPGNVDDVDVGCFAHVNLSKDWYAEEGPSSQKRRVDSGIEEGVAMDGIVEGEVVEYVGKGKGKMSVDEVEAGVGVGADREVICID